MCRKKKRYHLKKQFAKYIERQTIRKIMLLSEKDISEIVTNLTPLSKEDKLFVFTNDLHNSCLNRNPYIREHHLSESYFCNAIFLLDIIHESHSNAVRDGYIYPALFSFRHYLELTMKDTLNQKEGKIATVVTNKVHTLSDIWEEFKKYVPNDEECIIIESLIKELSDIDPNSYNFRYTYDIKGNRIRININNSTKENEDIMCDSDEISSLTPILIDNNNLKSIILKMYVYFEGFSWLAYKYKNI